MIFPRKIFLRALAALLCAAFTLSFSACKHSGGRVLETAYVSGIQVVLRDRVAAVYEKVGLVKNGDRVEVLDHDRHFAKVRTASGQMGWIEQRYLVSQQVYDELQKLTADNANDPFRRPASPEMTPTSTSNPDARPSTCTRFRQAKNSLCSNGPPSTRTPRRPPTRRRPSSPPKTSCQKRKRRSGCGGACTARTRAQAPRIRIRKNQSRCARGVKGGRSRKNARHCACQALRPASSHGRLVAGSRLSRPRWLGPRRMVDLDVPLDVAQYAEGQRIVAFFTLNEVQDEDNGEVKKVPQYLMVLTEPKDGQPFDFNQFRVFKINTRLHRYETAYRERLEGMLPVTVGKEDFGKEGVLPIFTVRVIDEDGKLSERKFKLNTPIVRRVIAPGEEPAKPLRKERRGRERREKEHLNPSGKKTRRRR